MYFFSFVHVLFILIENLLHYVLIYLFVLKIDFNFGGECEGNVGEFSTSSLTCPAIYKITCGDVINGISNM
jgi:hypothetical protein